MHPNAMRLMKEFVDTYNVSGKRVVDMGSYNVNGSFKSLFSGAYIGVDIRPGPGVDVIIGVDDLTTIGKFDVLVSGNTLEHVEDVGVFMSNCNLLLDVGGLMCIVVPSSGPMHDYPNWYRNYTECDLLSYLGPNGFEVLDITTSICEPFNDIRCVARKCQNLV